MSWRCIKKKCIADSTTEAEYIIACEAAKEAVWLKKFLKELGVVPASLSPIILYCDNSKVVAQSREPKTQGKGKYVERKYHLIRDIVLWGDVTITKIATTENLADPFTKATSKVFDYHLDSLGLRCNPSWL